MTKPDFVGRVTSVAVPRYDSPNKQPCFVFSIPEPTYPPGPPPPKAPTFYLDLKAPYANMVMQLIFSAYLSGVELQVGVIAPDPPDEPGAREVAWVQLPRAPTEAGSVLWLDE